MRRVRTTETTPDGRKIPRSDVWPLRLSPFGYIMDRNGIATVRYNTRYQSTGLTFCRANRTAAIEIGEKVVAEWRREERAARYGQAPAATPAGPITVALAWVEFYAAKVPIENRAHADRARLRWIWGSDRPLSDDTLYQMTVDGLERMRSDVVLQDGKVLKALAPASVKRQVAYWRDFCAYCRARGWIRTSPVDLVSLPRTEPKRGGTAYTDEELAAVDAHFAAMKPTPPRGDTHGLNPLALRLLFRFLALTGTRISEALALRWSDIVDADGRPDHIYLKVTKGGRPRVFPLAPFPEVVALLEQLRGSHGRDGYLFPWRRRQTPAEHLRLALAELGIDGGARPQHRFRATAHRLWRTSNVTPEVRLRLAGHTLDTYVRHYDPEATAAELTSLIARDRS